MIFIKQACREVSLQTYFKLKRTAGDRHQWRTIIRTFTTSYEVEILDDDNDSVKGSCGRTVATLIFQSGWTKILKSKMCGTHRAWLVIRNEPLATKKDIGVSSNISQRMLGVIYLRINAMHITPGS